MNLRSFIIAALVCIGGISCSSTDVTEIVTGIKNIELLEPLQDTGVRHILAKSSPKIVTFIDGRCNVCLDDFRQWYILRSDSAFCQHDIDIIYYVGTPNAQSIDMWTHRYKIRDFVIDPDRLFLRKNKLKLDDKIFHTFLLDRENRVVLVGSPIGNPRMWELYKTTIARLVENGGVLPGGETVTIGSE